MVLNGRLLAIANAVPRSGRVADIGTDHGYVPLYLIQKDFIESAIAADISQGSLKKAEMLVSEYNLEDRMETRLGSGLSVLTPEEVDTIIIAGMGGLLIRDILMGDETVARSATTLILQPMVAQDLLRRWLVNNCYTIKDEELVKEDQRIYEIIIASPGIQEAYSDIYLDRYPNVYYDIGWRLIEKQHPLLEEFVLKKIQSLEEIVEHLNINKTQSAMERMIEIKSKLKQYKEVYRWDIKSKTL